MERHGGHERLLQHLYGMEADPEKMQLLQRASSSTRRFAMLRNDSQWVKTQDGNDVLRWREVSQGFFSCLPSDVLDSSTQGTDELEILNALSHDDYPGCVKSTGVTLSECASMHTHLRSAQANPSSLQVGCTAAIRSSDICVIASHFPLVSARTRTNQGSASPFPSVVITDPSRVQGGLSYGAS